MARRLLGRDTELARLRAAFADAAAGTGWVVLITGEAGLGKSRLAAEALPEARSAGLRVLTGRTTEDRGAPPHWPWLQVLASLAAGDLLLAPAGSDPDAERFARQVAVTSALVEIPTAVLLEDVHRADPASLQLLVHVAREVAQHPVTLIATFRPNLVEAAPEFGAALDEIMRSPQVDRVDLVGLGLAEIVDLLGPAVPRPVAERVLAVSDGNPLLVGELARHLAAGGAIGTVPVTVRDSVQRRLSVRSSECVDAVRWGSLAGRVFPAALVARAAGGPLTAVLTALDEGVDAGFLEPGAGPGEYRFVHALVRDAAAGTMKVADRAARHRTLAHSVEALHGTGDDAVADIARHWEAAAAIGDADVAAVWCERAAEVADRRLAWDDAARLFDRALVLDDRADPVTVVRRALGSARARLHCDDLASTVECCLLAARTARDAGRPDLVAEAVLVPEARGVTSPELFELAQVALGGLDDAEHALRARVHGQLVNLGYYVQPESIAEHAEAAEAEAALAGDPLAELAAVRARYMLSYGSEHAELQLVLSERLGRIARAAQLPTAAVWEPLWRMDALVALGRMPEAAALLPWLRSAVAAAGTPIARWHLARTEGHLAQSCGRFADAVLHSATARDLYARLEDPIGAEFIHLTQLFWIGLHAGDIPGVAERLAEMPIDLAPSNLAEMPIVECAEACLRIGDLDRALGFYRRLSPVRGWWVPPVLGLYPWAMRLHAAAELGLTDEVEAMLPLLEPQRGQHVGVDGGNVNYVGPIELWLGLAAAAIQRWDDADRDLATASRSATGMGAPAFAVHADVERAAVLTARGAPGDAAEAARLLAAARPVAVRLGMPDFLARVDTALESAGAADAGPLTPREIQVAALLADARTNREIARTLVISERTAQNHVQHILTKLGLTNRREVATWYREGGRIG